MTEPTSTTNMTGLRTWTAGFSFLNESIRAWRRISRSKRLRDSATPWACVPGFGWFGCVVVIVIRRTFRG